MTDAIRAALLREAHHSIAEAADAGIARITDAKGGAVTLDYPPADQQSVDHMLTAAEATALARIAASDAASTGLRKLLREAASAPLFHLFSLLDGVADPRDWDGNVWSGADLVPSQDDEDREMLHDAFLDSYREFVDAHR
jgi:hypothetical protein